MGSEGLTNRVEENPHLGLKSPTPRAQAQIAARSVATLADPETPEHSVVRSVAALVRRMEALPQRGQVVAVHGDVDLTKVDSFHKPLGEPPDGIFFRGFDSRLWYQLRDGCD